ncbi:MAG: cytochrome c biogenesis protein CcsA [Firmicutes bacterium]|nr:cytochrome c biogenesis protein CcsA [Bacillota bacterium]
MANATGDAVAQVGPAARTGRPTGIPWAAGLLVLFWFGGFMAFLDSPDAQVLGATVRIFYIHVAVAWLAGLAFLVNWMGSILYLVRRDLRVDRWAAVSAEIGEVFTTAVLVTGSIWARVAWNTWWTWDPRLTTALVMWFLYLAYLVLREGVSRPESRAAVSAVVGIVAFVDVPVVFLSTRWWRSIHPVIEQNGTFALSPHMLLAMFAMLAAVTAFYVYILRLRVRQEAARDAIEAMRLRLRSRGETS